MRLGLAHYPASSARPSHHQDKQPYRDAEDLQTDRKKHGSASERLAKLHIALAFVALGSQTAFSVAKQATDALYQTVKLRPGASLDTTPVEFSIAGTVYRVPRNYLIAMGNWAGGPQDFVSMRVSGRHLTPLTKVTQRCFSDNPFGFSAKIMIEPASRVTGCMPFQFDIADIEGRETSRVTAEQMFEKIQTLVHSQRPLAGPFGFEKYELSLDNTPMEAYRKLKEVIYYFSFAESPLTMVSVLVFVVP